MLRPTQATCHRRPANNVARLGNSIGKTPFVNCWEANRRRRHLPRCPLLVPPLTGRLRRFGATRNNSTQSGSGWMKQWSMMKNPDKRGTRPPSIHGNTPLGRRRAPLASRPTSAKRRRSAMPHRLMKKQSIRSGRWSPQAGGIPAWPDRVFGFGASRGSCGELSSHRWLLLRRKAWKRNAGHGLVFAPP